MQSDSCGHAFDRYMLVVPDVGKHQFHRPAWG